MMSRALALLLTVAAAVPTVSSAAAAERPALRGDIVAARDELTLGELVENAPAAAAEARLFRAPALGQAGTIQVKRIVAAAETLGLRGLETGGRLQVTVTRAARHVGPAEIEAALRTQLSKEFGADADTTGIVFDGPQPALVASPEIVANPVASELTLDRRTRRVAATIWLGSSPSERKAQIRVTGQLVELVEVAVTARSLERGQALQGGDLVVERRARDLVPADAVIDGTPMEGRVARRAVRAGSLVRPADFVRPELVARGEVVSVVYEMPGVSLTLRAKAADSGAMGDAIGVINPQSKKTLQAVVVGPGRVSVSSALPGRFAAASSAR